MHINTPARQRRVSTWELGSHCGGRQRLNQFFQGNPAAAKIVIGNAGER